MAPNQDRSDERQRARFTITPESPPDAANPPPYVPDHLLHGVFAHSVRTFAESGMMMIDFSYNAPLEWHHGPAAEYSFEHVVVARVLMPEHDFREWVRKSATALGILKAEG